jgi:hypothetical protein
MANPNRINLRTTPITFIATELTYNPRMAMGVEANCSYYTVVQIIKAAQNISDQEIEQLREELRKALA